MKVDPRTDRQHLTTESYGDAQRLSSRQQLYRFSRPPDGEPMGPITEWLFGLVGGAAALPRPIVDVGTGNGNYLRDLGGFDPIGFDLSEGMLRDARASGCEGPLGVADLQALPLCTASVGTAMANHMLYHLPDIALGVVELRRVVRDDGVVLAVTNGDDHIGEIAGVLNAAANELGGSAGFVFDRSGMRFTLENGGDAMHGAFSDVTIHHRRTELVVPEVEPVLEYMASMRALAVTLPDGVSYDAMLDICRKRVTEIIEREGAFVVSVHAGAFVCRP